MERREEGLKRLGHRVEACADGDKALAGTAAAAARMSSWLPMGLPACLPACLRRQGSREERERERKMCVRKLLASALAVIIVMLFLRGLSRAPEVNLCGLASESLGLPCEEHMATTKDGYQLYLKRLPRPGAPSVLLLPGLADSAVTWLLSGRKAGLAGRLFDAGFDVWLLEKRGRTPWRHEKFTGQDMEFWDFSFDESIEHDVPALVDYVRRFTDKPVGALVGHSEGAMIAVTALAVSPTTAQHVGSVVALGPPLAWTGAGTRMPLIPNFVVQNMHPAILLGFTRIVFTGLCAHAPGLCWNIICMTAGCSNADQYDPEVVSQAFSYYPRETSLKNLQHLVQCERAGRLQRFDHGPAENTRRYGVAEAPPYDLSKLTTPTALFFGTEDRMVPASVVNATLDLLPAEAVRLVNASVPFGHTDFVWSPDADKHVYTAVIGFINRHL